MFSRKSVALALALVLLAATASAAAPSGPPVHGKTMGDWGLAWWQWVIDFPSATNPLLQEGEVDCSAGQKGPVWFLAGTFGATTTRSCPIPRGKSLFFPLINNMLWAPEDASDEAGLRAGVTEAADTSFALVCEVDGVPCSHSVAIVRQQSAALPLVIDEDSIAVEIGYAPGVRPMAVSDGVWVMLPPPSPGPHVIHFAAQAGGGFALDVTYDIVVE